jgi:hypothetical protein
VHAPCNSTDFELFRGVISRIARNLGYLSWKHGEHASGCRSIVLQAKGIQYTRESLIS